MKKALGVAYAVKKKNGPKMASSGAFSTKLRDQEDDLLETAKPEEGPQKQPSKAYDEVGAKKKGPSVPSLHMKMMAEGGMVDDEERQEHHASVAAAIMARDKRKMMADGGMVDISSNAEEDANMMDELNEAALKENYDSDFEDVSQPMDSNEHGDKLSDEDMRSMSKIQKIMHRMRSK